MFVNTFWAFFSFPPRAPPGPSRGPARRVKSVYVSLLGRSKAAKVNFWDAPGLSGRQESGPREAPGEATGAQGPPTGLQEPFWSDFGPAGERFGPNFDRCQQHLRGNLLYLRGAWAEPRRTAQRRSRKSCRKKLSRKSSKPPAGQMCRAHVPLAVVVDLRRSNGQE